MTEDWRRKLGQHSMQHHWGKNDLNFFHKLGNHQVETRRGGTLAVNYSVVEFCLTFLFKHIGRNEAGISSFRLIALSFLKAEGCWFQMSFQISILLAVSSVEYHIPHILLWGCHCSSLTFPTIMLSHAIKSSCEDEAVPLLRNSQDEASFPWNKIFAGWICSNLY